MLRLCDLTERGGNQVHNMQARQIAPDNRRGTLRTAFQTLSRYKAVYLLLLPGLVWYILFAIAPLGGLMLAFKTYRANLGILGSPWTGLKNFDRVFNDMNFWNAIRQTLLINVLRLIITFPFPVVLALLFNEMRFQRVKKPMQVVFTLPHFLSWVIIASIFNNLLSYDGMLNNSLAAMGLSTVKIIGNERAFLPLLYYTDIWRTAGWNTIIYLSAMTGIDQEIYEAARVDGCSRFRMMVSITVPCILDTVVIMLILAIGGLVSIGFEQPYVMQNSVVMEVADVVSTYVYRVGLQQGKFSIGTAVGLAQSVINFILVISANTISKRMTGKGIW